MIKYFFVVLILLVSFNCKSEKMKSSEDNNLQIAYFGGGCFWCTEAVFELVDGVVDVESGYSGGKVENPTYEQVCGGTTGHAEIVKITFNPEVVSYRKLLEIFFASHNPTTLNRQGADKGTQYRSVIFYLSEDQKKETENYIKEVSNLFEDPIVTEVTEFKNYYRAENYHQDYFKNNPSQGYCSFVIAPKVKKFIKTTDIKLK